MAHRIVLNYDIHKKLEDQVLTTKDGIWIKRGIREGDIVRIKAYLALAQPTLFPPAGLMIVLKMQDGIFSNPPNCKILYVLSKKRGKFMIESDCCEIEIGGYYDP